MVLYIETSAVLAWLFGEDAADAVIGAINSHENIVTSVLTVLEIDRGLNRAACTAVISEVQAGRLRKLSREQLRGWELMEITREVRDRAGKPFPAEPVRSLDAIHLATGLQFLEIYDDVHFLSLDKRIRENLEPLGFSHP